MSKSQSFDFKSLKRETVDSLITKCKKYVKKYFSKTAAIRLDKAYKESKFDEVKSILEMTLKRIKTKIKVSEFQEAEKAVMDEFPNAEKLFASSDNNEGSQNEDMGTGGGMIAVIVIIVAILVIAIIGALVYLKLNNKTVGEVLSLGMQKDNNSNKTYHYTDKDRDMMSLIHELSKIYDNTDHFMNS